MRLAAFGDLFATAVIGVDRPEATRLRLELIPEPDIASRFADRVCDAVGSAQAPSADRLHARLEEIPKQDLPWSALQVLASRA